MVTGAYREFFAAAAGSAAALTGLLFVAMSVAPRRDPDAGQDVIQQVRAAAALLAFVNPLAVSLFGLVPDGSVRFPAIVLGIFGILFTAAGIKSIFSSPSTIGRRRRQLGLIILLLLIFGAEVAVGIALLADPRSSGPVQNVGYVLVASLLVGIARAWELVGDRDTGVFASIAVLTRHAPGPPRTADGSAVEAAGKPAVEATGAAEADGASGHHPGDHEASERPG